MTFLNAALLFGLAAVLIPPVVHLFNRRRHDEVEWAAMQFLRLAPATRRRVTWEQLLLMLMRMALLAVLVLALAAPTVNGSLWRGGADRDIAVVIDGSASMGYKPPTPAADAAKRWADDFLGSLRSGDRVAVVQARQTPVPVVPALTADHDSARVALDFLAPPTGTADWPAAVRAALAILNDGRPNRHVVIITDGQRYGWADDATLARWPLVRDPAARIWVVNVAADRPPDPANEALDPITTGRAVATAGRAATFRSTIRFTGPDAPPPGKVRFEVDGRTVGEAKPAGTGTQLPLRFTHTFPPGSHVVTLVRDPDDLPADDRQDFAVEVLSAVPVLIVGDSDFLRDALAPAGDPTPAFAVRVIAASEFRPTSLTDTPSRVLVLANLPRLTTDQAQAVERFLAAGGSVLVLLGDRADAAAWNRVAYRGGQGFLPARLVEVVGGADAPSPDPATFTDPATEAFRDPLPGGLHTAVFPRRWKLDPNAGVNGATGTPLARLTTGEPLLIERGFGTGRVVVSAVPLDGSWGTNLPRLPDFVRLAHELAYHLVGARGADRNLDPTQPIVFAPTPAEPPGPVTLTRPDGRSRAVPVTAWPAVIDGPHGPGAYKLTTAAGRAKYFAVRPDPQESVLTPCTDDDRRKVADAVGGLAYITSADEIADRDDDAAARQDLWWVLMLVVVGLLGLEVWYTRRLAAE